ncbi:MAG: TRAP transporter small permease [Pseudomonadota bacterium]
MGINKTESFEKWVRIMSRALLYVCAGLLALMLFLGTSDVIGRYLLNRPIIGTLETFEILLPAMVLLSLAYTQREKAHVTVDILFSHLPRRPRAILGIVTTCWAIGLFAVLVWQGILQILLYHETEMVITNIKVPMFLPRILVPIGGLAICLVLIADLLRFIAEAKKRD